MLEDASEWSEDDAEQVEFEQQCITARRQTIQEARKIWSPDAKAHAGVIVTVDREGEAAVVRGLIRDLDRKAVVAAIKVADETEGQGGEEAEAIPMRRPAKCSQSLLKRLAAHRTIALQAMLSRDTPVALAALTYLLLRIR